MSVSTTAISQQKYHSCISSAYNNDISYYALGVLSVVALSGAVALCCRGSYFAAGGIASGTLILDGASLYLKPTILAKAELEKEYLSSICIEVDITANCEFEDYLAPNEGTPKGVQPHLDKMENGLIVSTGTERSLYDLLLADEAKCSGLVIRDINPKVKAYMDFLIMLIRISESREEFVQFVEKKEVASVSEKLKSSPLLEELKNYYMKNLELFSKVYFSHEHENTCGDNEGVKYMEEDALFAKLQRYAHSGAIITTIGDICDLEFLEKEKIAVVDTSNISDYLMIDLKVKECCQPRVITTSQDLIVTKYYSYSHQSLKLEQKHKALDLVGRVHKIGEIPSLWLREHADNGDTKVCAVGYTQQSFGFLQKTITTNIIYINDSCGYIDMTNPNDRLNALNKRQLKLLVKKEEIKHHIKYLVSCWDSLDPHVYMAFMDLKGWKKAFLEYMSCDHTRKKQFIQQATSHQHWESFPTKFGATDWVQFCDPSVENVDEVLRSLLQSCLELFRGRDS